MATIEITSAGVHSVEYEGGSTGNTHIGSDLDGLPAARIASIDRAFYRHSLEPGALGPVVAAVEAHDRRLIGLRAGFAAHLEFDGLARPDGEPVAVADDLQHHSTANSWPVNFFQRNLKTAHSASSTVA